MHSIEPIPHSRVIERRLESLERANVGLVWLSRLLLMGGGVLALVGVFS
jgi:hypothetical protein